METTIKEFKLTEYNLVELVYSEVYSDYIVRYLIDFKFGHKVFTNLQKAEKFYDQLKTVMVENSIAEKLCS